MIRRLIFLLLALVCLQTQAARITDKLLAGVYAEAQVDDSPINVLPSGTPFETLETQGDFTRIRLSDNTEGWVESRFITNEKPARIMLLELQAKNSRLQQDLRNAQQQLKLLDSGTAPIDPSADTNQLTDLQRQLASSQAETVMLRKQLDTQLSASNEAERQEEIRRLKAALTVSQQALNKTLNELNAQKTPASDQVRENEQLRQQIQQAAAILGAPSNPAQPTNQSLRLNAWHLPLLALALLFSFIGGIAFKNYRLSKRYGGFRI